MNSRTLKLFLYAFLLILAGSFIFVGSSTQTLNQGIANYPVNATAASFTVIGLVLIFLGLLIGLLATLGA